MKMGGLNPKKVIAGLVLTVVTALALSGCGGSGGSSSTTTTTTTTTTSITSIMGIGVIAQSKSSVVANSLAGSGGLSPNWKRLDVSLVNQSTTSNSRVASKVVASVDLTGDDLYAYIYLSWNAVSGASAYQVYYGDSEVWSSSGSHSDDPSDGSTVAYLDLDDELSGVISAAGSYTFTVKAVNSSATVLATGSVTVSLGVTLESYPTDISYTDDTHVLSWTSVSGASGYRVQLYTDSDYADQSLDSGTSSLLTGTSYDLSGQSLSGYYYGTVDAWVTDSSGNPTEIARGITGFTY